MNDVIRWHAEYPNDWKQTWFECEKKWSEDIGCPDGVFVPFNIDAVINSAYILIGLLYGEGDFFKTMDIATRCGQDSDCNPASAAGILGTILGYSQIPEYWMKNLKEEWDELCVVSENLFNGDYEDEDLYDVAGYVVQEKSDRTRLLIADAENPVVTDVSKGGFVSVDDFYGDTTLDLINCAVGRGAKEVTLDASFKDKRLLSALSRFAKVRNI